LVYQPRRFVVESGRAVAMDKMEARPVVDMKKAGMAVAPGLGSQKALVPRNVLPVIAGERRSAPAQPIMSMTIWRSSSRVRPEDCVF
jgi:hypothetical protein